LFAAFGCLAASSDGDQVSSLVTGIGPSGAGRVTLPFGRLPQPSAEQDLLALLRMHDEPST
jgi:hypothetical protein